MAEKQTFETVLEKHENMDATGITIPFDVEKIFGAKRVPVKVSINGATHRSTIIKMNGKFIVGVPKIFRAAAKVEAGELITVSIEKDSEKRAVEVPKDLAEALKKHDLTDVFAKMSFTHQKEYANAVNEAKREETRIKRIEKCAAMLLEKKK